MNVERARRSAVVSAGIVLVSGLALSAPVAMAGDLAAGSTAGATAFGPQSYRPLRVTADVRASVNDPVPTRTFSSPYMLIDPDNPRVVVASAVEMRSRICYLLRSDDAGATWSILPAVPALASYPDCFTVNGGATQTPLAWGRHHTLYYGLLGYDNQDGGASRKADISVQLARSTNLGSSWNTVLVDNNRGKMGTATTNDGIVASIAVDSHSSGRDIVYVGWRQSQPFVKGSPNRAMVATSADGGQTFAAPVNIGDFYHASYTDVNGKTYQESLGTPQLAVNQRAGTLYAVASASVPFSVIKRPPLPIMLAVSTDHGRSFTVRTAVPPSFTATLPVLRWSPMGGPQGTLLLVYENNPDQTQGNEFIFFQRSTDGGRTWSAPLRLDDDNPAQQYNHFMPDMSVAPNGRIDVAWFDFRQTNAFADNVYYTYSTDDGTTWAHNIRVTSRPINLDFGVNSGFDVRQPVGIASSNQYAAFGWSDTRLATPSTQTQDVFTADVQFAPLPAPGSQVLSYLAAILGGVAVAGLIFFVAVLARRRPKAVPPASPSQPQHEPVGSG